MQELEEARSLIAKAVQAAKPMWSTGDGRGTFLVDEMKRALREAGLTKTRGVSGKAVTRFDEFWEIYPKRVDKAGCLRKWSAHGLDALADRIINHVRAKAASRDWVKEEGRYVPMPATYLNQRRWEGDPAGTLLDDGWALEAGFSDRYEAENAGCFRHNASQFRYGVRVNP